VYAYPLTHQQGFRKISNTGNILEMILVAAMLAASCSSTGTRAITGSTFTDIAALETWLSAQPTNTASSPYAVTLNVSDIGGFYGGLYMRSANDTKYVSLDLSGSTFVNNHRV
jgi:hypothetical protein